MTKEQIVALVIRLFSVFLLIYGIRSVAYVVPLNDIQEMPVFAWLWVGLFLLLFISIVLLFWKFPLLIARKILPSDEIKDGESL